jgi:hypothetical protein
MYRTLRLTDGAITTLHILSSGPCGVISTPHHAPPSVSLPSQR